MPRKSWWARLPFGVRMTAGAGALLIAIGGAAAGIAALTRDTRDKPRIVTAVGQATRQPLPADSPAPRQPAARGRYGEAATVPRARTAPRSPRRAAAPPAPGAPAPARNSTGPAAAPSTAPARSAPTTRTEVETREIPFQTRLVRDSSLPHGSKRIQTPGVPGEETLRYLVTVTDGQVTDRRLLDTRVTRHPQHRVVAFGPRRVLGHQPDRDCRRALSVCVPLGRSAICPDDRTSPKRAARDRESLLPPGGSVVVLDQDLELLDAETLDLGPAC
jgi:hypothetical protein